MNEPVSKTLTPVYVSWGAFVGFINKLRDTSLPQRIDRSLMGNASGSLISSLMAAIKSLGLIDDAQRPTETMRALVSAADEHRKTHYEDLFRRTYTFVSDDPEFHLESATTAQLAQKFREQGTSGSTVVKAIAFFLSLAKAAEVKVSPHLKAPPSPRPNGKRTGKAASKLEAEAELAELAVEEGEEVERFEIPIPGKASVRVIVPKDLDGDDWEMLQSMITVYIKRWKGFKPGGVE